MCGPRLTCNPSTQEAKAGEYRVPDQPGLHNDSVSKKKKSVKIAVINNKAEWEAVFKVSKVCVE
jgi:hypothetical protein